MTTINEPPINPNSTSDYLESSVQQKLREHVFISELLQEIWIGERQTMEVLRSEVDNYGYDLLLALDGIVRYVQLKSSRADAKTSRQTVNNRLADKPGGCVIWLRSRECGLRYKFEYWVLGGKPGEKPNLGDKTGKQAKGDATGYKAERPNTRVLSKSPNSKLQGNL